ncbi:hypothetical protein FNW02_37015 [Komarekiella sp. 'clone 1']|uniref:Uncharacterized protein n=1 Tax=Komarekiella delphini-convector SJRDD-AB1 TaxID=2593771 RepID=A0AA40VVW9_9NOST|nr:hypothetical protein [Komarekiella delphini-convector]MBD6621153.1 hypothetical protein [Komarekiella delphini-convector SJRDD-AB1]
MYNDDDDLSFEEQLQLTESQIRRRHQQRIFMRRNAELLQQELELEAELLEENPELNQVIHELNTLEIQTGQQGLKDAIQGESSPKHRNVWDSFFPGLK